jgi:hypothetical protein
MSASNRDDRQMEEPPIVGIAKALDGLGFEIKSYNPVFNPTDIGRSQLIALEIIPKTKRS